MPDTEYLIIGGGPTGLGAACRLHDTGREWQLLEKEDHFGGLASSFVDEQGFTWDRGGHVQFSHYETFDRFMELALGKDGWFTHERESWVWIKKRFVPYPFQNNLHRLDPDDRDRCVHGLRQAADSFNRHTAAIHNFRDWILASVGEGIADIFLVPYNFKVWAYPPERLDYHWIGERVAIPNLEAVTESIRTGRDQVSWGPNRVFRFPRHGGTGAIWQSLGGMLPSERIHLSTKVARIDARRHVLTTAHGDLWSYRHLITTMPLNQLIQMTDGLAGGSDAGKLLWSGTHVVGVGMDGFPPEHLKTKCWMYFPESNSPYYRVTVFSHYSCNNVARPGGQWSIMTETAESVAKPVQRDRLEEETLQALMEDGLLPNRSRIVTTVHRFIPQGYPTPFLGRDAVVDPWLRTFESMDIFSRGRFGAWKYEVGNQDHSFAQGYECAERLLNQGGPEYEPTLFMPSVVNSRRNP